jgi:hypothetical protein
VDRVEQRGGRGADLAVDAAAAVHVTVECAVGVGVHGAVGVRVRVQRAVGVRMRVDGAVLVPVPVLGRRSLVRVHVLAVVRVRMRMDAAVGVAMGMLVAVDGRPVDPGVAFAAAAGRAHGVAPSFVVRARRPGARRQPISISFTRIASPCVTVSW